MDRKKILFTCISFLLSTHSFSFCGFFVSKAGTNLFNDASKVVIARDEDKTVLSMVNNFKGDPKEFAMVIPVPTVLKRKQINVASNSLVDHLDSYTAPRLVEYRDSDPCVNRYKNRRGRRPKKRTVSFARLGKKQSAKSLGVKIEAEYQVGEYDILILSAKESDGLITWLNQNKYKMPKGAKSIVSSYLKKGMKFFVAKVNMKKQAKTGFKFLRPLQVAYKSKKFMLPIRLGMLNAKGPQDLFVFALTKKGRIETVNYKTKELPSNIDIPSYVKDEFPKFYKDMYSHQVKNDKMKSVWLEYAWDMNWCDPCAADPLSSNQLRELGAFWEKKTPKQDDVGRPFRSQARNVYVTRLHVRYDKKNFPDDLQFQVTSNRKNFQGRYVMRHKWTGEPKCKAANDYYKKLPEVISREVKNLSDLTGWKEKDIKAKVDIKIPDKLFSEPKDEDWVDGLWN